MTLGRKLLPIAGPVGIAAVLAVASTMGGDEPASEARAPVQREHAPGPARPEPAPPSEPAPPARPAGPPIDRPRCLASMTVQELGRQLMTMRQAQAIAELHREEAPPELARAYLQGLADSAATLRPGVARSRLLVAAADGLVRLGHAEPARAALAASRDLPPPLPSDFDFERSDWHAEAAQVAARLDDHALARTLVEGDAEARAELAQHYAEAGDSTRARELLGGAAPDLPSIGWRLAQAAALAGVGEQEAALSLADGVPRDAKIGREATLAHVAVLARIAVARTLTRQDRRDDAATVLLSTLDAMPEALEWRHRLGAEVAIADLLDEAGRRDAALALLERTRAQLQAQGDHFQALGLWGGLIELEHRLGKTEQAWADVEAFGKLSSLAEVNAAPMTRVLMLVREGKLAKALEVIHATAAITYPLAYSHVLVALREPDPALERELDDGLRLFCP